jgi:ABC-type branched-subunit amino acid transport system substrate-binding protein
VNSTASTIDVASLVLIAALSAISVFHTTRRPTLMIGVALSLSGPASVGGQATLEGIVRDVGELNAIRRTSLRSPAKIKLLVFDDGDDSFAAEWVARELVRRDVIAVIGNPNSRLNGSAVSVYETHGIPHFSFETGSTGGLRGSSVPCDAVKIIIESVRESSEFDVERLRSKLRVLCGQEYSSPVADSEEASPRGVLGG